MGIRRLAHPHAGRQQEDWGGRGALRADAFSSRPCQPAGGMMERLVPAMCTKPLPAMCTKPLPAMCTKLLQAMCTKPLQTTQPCASLAYSPKAISTHGEQQSHRQPAPNSPPCVCVCVRACVCVCVCARACVCARRARARSPNCNTAQNNDLSAPTPPVHAPPHLGCRVVHRRLAFA